MLLSKVFFEETKSAINSLYEFNNKNQNRFQ